MAITILERPKGVVLGTCVDANINEDYNGFATVNKALHNLQDNDWVYIQSDVENYNGFWQVDVINTGEFALLQYDGTYLPYIVNTNVTYCPGIQTHGWSCVHLPITYRISNNRYPVNSIDTVRIISTLADNNGFTQIGLSGSLGTFEDLQFIKISNAPDSDLDGVYQVIDKLSTSSVILNIAYTSVTNATLLGASIQLYYGNYNVVVKVYAGINAAHEWASEKPYELAATLELIPDENNEVFFSINDILKPYVKTENNLLLPTLPNNIDAWTNFYISTGEAYDTSNGYTVSTLSTGFTSDQSTFEGTAANAELEFKNIHSGYLSGYINPISWLTLFGELTVFAGQYFDISFIEAVTNGTLGYRVKNYINDVLQSTTDYAFNQDARNGVYRFKPEYDPTSDKIKVSILLNGGWDEQPENNTFTGTMLPWVSWDFNGGPAWGYNSNNVRVQLTGPQTSQRLVIKYILRKGVTYQVSVDYTVATNNLGALNFIAFNTGDSLNINDSSGGIGIGSGTQLYNVTPTKDLDYIGFVAETGSPVNPRVDLDNVVISFVSSGVVSEELTININSECTNQSIDLQWLNNLGGFDAWRFTAQSEHAIDITEATETKKNIFPQWPKSFGANADSIRKPVSRESMIKKFIVSQNLDQDQADAIAYIKSSPLVQIVNSRQDRRTVIVDTDSFVKYTDGDKVFTIQFAITYTDDIPSQKG